MVSTDLVYDADKANVERYLSEIRRYTPLSSDEEQKLARRIKAGDSTAVEKLVRANLRFVVKVARQYANQGLELGDLICEGNAGLVKAAMNFDEKKNFKFISYAVWWIRQSILLALSEKSRVVRIPANKVRSVSEFKKKLTKLEQGRDRPLSVEEISAEFNISCEDVLQFLGLSNPELSLDRPSAEDGTETFIDYVPSPFTSDGVCHKRSERQLLLKLISALPEKEAKVVSMYYGIDTGVPMILEDIGARLNLTRERVRQIRDKALKKLKNKSLSLQKVV